ncbi:hypothetical protein [Chlamydia gallinacea]|uniref:hypothetical protein n=1 Tax=Chlamydia gallinacea TaxID=1457153 RepID=UPI0024E26C81|nr:hypothetical protein [Chlamydia gallinacea]
MTSPLSSGLISSNSGSAYLQHPLYTQHVEHSFLERHGLTLSSQKPLSSLKILPYQTSPKTCRDHVRSIGEKISLFLRDNWKYILLNILAWAIILACHHTVAATLTIWLGIGLGAGVIFGIFTSTALDRQNAYKNINSIWNLMNYGLQQLDPNGTRQILLATIVASISSLIYAIPQAVGFAFGATIGNQISILTIYGLRLGKGSSGEKQEAFKKNIVNIQNVVNYYQLIKNQMIMQKQIAEIAKHQNNEALINALHTLQLQMNSPLPYVVDIFYRGYEDQLHFSNPDLVIATANQRILTLSQVLSNLRQEPNLIIEG